MYSELDNMCNYCGDEIKKYGIFCSLYCQYKHDFVIPRKKQIIKNILKKKEKEKEQK